MLNSRLSWAESHISLMQATKSWAGAGNEATKYLVFLHIVQPSKRNLPSALLEKPFMVTQVSSVMIVCSSVMMSSPSRLPIMGLRTRPAR